MGEVDKESVGVGTFPINILNNLAWMPKIMAMTADTLLVLNEAQQIVDLLLKTENPLLHPYASVIGRNVLDILPVDSAELLQKELNFVRSTGIVSNMNYTVSVDGQLFYFKLIVHKLSAQYLLCQYRDVSHSATLKDRLQSKAIALMEVEKEAKIRHWSYDTTSSVISYPAYAMEDEVVSIISQTILLEEYLQYVHEDDRPLLRKFKHHAEEKTKTIEYRVIRNGQSIKYLRATRYGQQEDPQIISGFTQDVTDFMRNRSELEMVLSVVQRSPRSVIAAKSSGEVIFINTKGRTVSGLGEEQDLAGVSIFNLVEEFSTPAKWNTFKDGLEKADGELRFRIKNPYPTMDILEMECVASVVKNWEGQDIIWLFQHDISDQIRYQEQLLKSKEAAEESEKLKMAFILNMNHEIRTPLSSIVGLSMLIADTDDAESRHEYAKLVTSSSDQLLRLITDVLEMSKIDAGNMRLILHLESMNILFQELKLSFSHVVGGATLEVQIPEEDTIAYLDKGRMMQLLTNLINNSRKFTALEGKIILRYTVLDNMIELCVEDNGIGIAKEKQAHIFTRFYKVDASDQGTGLGLAICKSIVEEMKGEIWVESEEGVGTTFKIRIPLLKEKLAD